MSRAGWYPMKELENYFRHHATRPPRESDGGRESVTSADWAPAVDISETAETYRIDVELTGVDRESVELSLNDGALLIQGERPVPEEAGRRYHRLERPHGHFQRRFELPDNVEATEITAELSEGMLQLTLPKHRHQPARATKIEIR